MSKQCATFLGADDAGNGMVGISSSGSLGVSPTPTSPEFLIKRVGASSGTEKKQIITGSVRVILLFVWLLVDIGIGCGIGG